MTKTNIRRCITTLAGLLLAWTGTGTAQARDGVNWSVGVASSGAVFSMSNTPAVVLPAPAVVPHAVVVPARPVYVAAPLYTVVPVHVPAAGKHRGKGWHKKHDRHGSRSDFWRYESGAPVVLQAASPVWVH